MNAWKVILATLVIFTTGLITGGLLVGFSQRAQQKHNRAWMRETTERRLDNVPRLHNQRETLHSQRESFSPKAAGGLPQVLRADFLQRLKVQLNLTPEQHERIEKVILEGQERNRQLWNRVLPEMRAEMQETKGRIRAELKPEQVQRFEELMKQSRPRRGDEPIMTPDRRLRDQPRRPMPREGFAPAQPPSSDNP